MKRRSLPITRFLLLAGTLGAPLLAAEAPSDSPELVQKPAQSRNLRLDTEYGRLPLSFEANQGQTNSQVKFLSRGPGYTLFLTSTEAVLMLRHGSKIDGKPEGTGFSPYASGEKRSRALAPEGHPTLLRLKLIGANRRAKVIGMEELPGISNYFLGNDPKKWRTNVPHFAKVRYENIYPGIDLIYYGTEQGQLEYDFIVHPGADPSRIRMEVDGADRLRLTDDSHLVLQLPKGELQLRQPMIYQDLEAGRVPVSGRYILHGKRNIIFNVAGYDAHQPLVIDPVLIYSTYLGGSMGDVGTTIAVDGGGNAYVAGRTESFNFPTANAIQNSPLGTPSAFITKLNSNGSALAYSTYLGGVGGSTEAYGIRVDSAGNAYVAGFTQSLFFPTTPGAFQSSFGGGFSDAFVLKLNASGTALVYSSYLGGAGFDNAFGISIDGDGNAYVVGSTNSASFPTTNSVLQPTAGGNADAFVTKVNPTGSSLIYSTYLGGANSDSGFGIALDASRNAYVTGSTDSPNFLLVNPIDTIISGEEAFVSAINTSGTILLYSTFLGGVQGDVGRSIAVDAGGNAYVTGETFDGSGFPLLNPAQPQFGGVCDAFVTKFDPSGALVYSTFLGGSSFDEGRAIAINPAGRAIVIGRASPEDYPTTPDAFQTSSAGFEDAFVAVLLADGSQLVFSTYLGGAGTEMLGLGLSGGMSVDSQGRILATGDTGSINFPTTTGVFQTANGGGFDAFVVKIEVEDNPLPTLNLISPSNTVAGGPSLTITLTGANFIPGSIVLWNGSPRSTTLASNTVLTVAIPATDLTNAGVAQVSVFNPGGGRSNALPFNIASPVPAVTSMVPDTIPAGSPSFALSIKGSGFFSGVSVARLNGINRNTAFVSSTQLTAQIPASDVATPGTRLISVFNSPPGGGISNPLTLTVSLRNPLPTITALSPPGTTAGSSGFMLSMFGSNFVFNSTVQWDGAPRATSFLNNGQLQVLVPATDLELADIGTHPVTVVSPAPGGGTSNPVTFSVQNAPNPAPTLTSLVPESETAGIVRTSLPVMVNGTNFAPDSVVRWNGMNRTTSFVDASHLMATIPGSDLLTAGTADVTVLTPVPGGGASNALPFTVNNPVPILTSLSPSTAAAGGPAFTLAVIGSNFIPGSVVRWNGSARPTTFIGNSQLRAAIAATDLTSAGSASVTVFTPTPGGGESAPQSFTINSAAQASVAAATPTMQPQQAIPSRPEPAPAVLVAPLGTSVRALAPIVERLQPAFVIAGSGTITVVVKGENFTEESVVWLRGKDLPTKFVSETELEIELPASALAQPGELKLTVFTPGPGGGTSKPATLQVQAP